MTPKVEASQIKKIRNFKKVLIKVICIHKSIQKS